MAASALDLGGILALFAIGAAVLLVGHARTGGVGALLFICHEFCLSSRKPSGQSSRLDAGSEENFGGRPGRTAMQGWRVARPGLRERARVNRPRRPWMRNSMPS